MKKIEMMLMLAVFGAVLAQTQAAEAPYLDAKLPVEKRVDDLMGRMTLHEKIGQMCQYTGEVNFGKDTTGFDGITEQLSTVQNPDDYARNIEGKLGVILRGEVGSFMAVPGLNAANQLQKIAEQSRLKIPLLIATDAVHGHAEYPDPVTVFPHEMAMASTFEPALAEKLARMTRAEMRATGHHWTYSPYVAVVRDQRWGRSGENFGEDPFLVSEMGRAMVRGYQGATIGSDSVLACVKAMVCEGEPVNGINAGEADISPRTLRAIHLPPFEACVKEGAFTIMAAHNAINGVPCHSNKELFTDILRKEWGFKGFVISDWMDIKRLHTVFRTAESHAEGCAQSVDAGIDVNMQGGGYLEPVEEAVKSGRLSEAQIDAAVRPILEAKFRLGLFENRYVDPVAAEDVLMHQDHLDAALGMARKGVILLKNEKNILPITSKSKKVLVTGPSANRPFQLGDWCTWAQTRNVVTTLEGIKEAVPAGTTIEYVATDQNTSPKGASRFYFNVPDALINKAVEKAAECDVAVVVVGESAIRRGGYRKTAGENCDYSNLQLPGNQIRLIQEIQKTGTPTVVVLINTRALDISWSAEYASAILVGWEGGLMSGRAIGEILFGKVNPSGKLPISFPRSVGHLKCFYNSLPQRLGKFGDSSAAPLYPFGHGLSYTTFKYSNLQCPSQVKIGNSVTVTVDVTNTGDVVGDEVVMLYSRDQYASVVMPVKELKAFKRVSLNPGETKTVSLNLGPEALSLINAKLERIVEPGKFTIMVDDLKTTLMMSRDD